jgi:predicted O-linked N-acetylglucosamine transferase (SPINDLY family)
VVERFAAHGVARERVRCVAKSRLLAEHYALYGEVDIALDPWPYNGTTTSCEAMWMGSPVVALKGEEGRHAARVSASLLDAIGLSDLAAADLDDYVRVAAALAADRARLSESRTGLRARMRASPLMDARATAAGLEAIYREAILAKR